MKRFVRIGNSDILFRKLEDTVSHIKVQFLVPKEHPYRVGQWHNNVKFISAHTTKDNKFTCVTYIGVNDLYVDYDLSTLTNLFDMVRL